jgi:hypothetical protein
VENLESGAPDPADERLARLDLVLVSVHSRMNCLARH